MRILPRAQREAMFEIYSFCRAVDDIADDPARATAQRAHSTLARRHRRALCRLGRRRSLRGLAEAVRAFDLDASDFLAVIDGMEMDVVADIRAPDRATLDLYCDRVACAVGRLSVRVFGMERDAGLALAHHLGRALQLTNILRDLDEDAAIGRLYLPREALHAAGITATDPREVLAHPMLGKACAAVVALAEAEFQARARSWRKARAAWCGRRASWARPIALILDRLIARGFAPPRPRGPPAARKVPLIVLRNLV